ncbi:MMPL family transporter OS=Streptomyces microflavus OX=1919 GN=G3I39_27335 PE=4 SV=1 [Streptomyces microflavus]
MDYGVLLSRIKEEYDRTGDHERSVTFGLSRTGGLITAAAVILAVVMVAIGTSNLDQHQDAGLGIALAVLMDAMVIRSLLVPAVMKLTGRATWWAPKPLRAFHQRFGLGEGESAPAASGTKGEPGGRGSPRPTGRYPRAPGAGRRSPRGRRPVASSGPSSRAPCPPARPETR